MFSTLNYYFDETAETDNVPEYHSRQVPKGQNDIFWTARKCHKLKKKNKNI